MAGTLVENLGFLKVVMMVEKKVLLKVGMLAAW